MRECIRCHQSQTLEQFIVRNKRTGNRATVCRKCRAKLHNAWYHRTKHEKIELRNRYKNISHQRSMQIVVNYLKIHPCVDCGEKDILVLEFDHIRDKENVISKMVRSSSRRKLLLEIQKCEIRCANCHRRKTAKRGNWYLKQGFLTQ